MIDLVLDLKRCDGYKLTGWYQDDEMFLTRRHGSSRWVGRPLENAGAVMGRVGRAHIGRKYDHVATTPPRPTPRPPRGKSWKEQGKLGITPGFSPPKKPDLSRTTWKQYMHRHGILIDPIEPLPIEAWVASAASVSEHLEPVDNLIDPVWLEQRLAETRDWFDAQ